MKFDASTWVALGIAAAGACTSWGVASTRLNATESRLNVQSQHIEAVETKINGHDVTLAVQTQKLDDIVERLGRIEAKIDWAAGARVKHDGGQ